VAGADDVGPELEGKHQKRLEDSNHSNHSNRRACLVMQFPPWQTVTCKPCAMHETLQPAGIEGIERIGRRPWPTFLKRHGAHGRGGFFQRLLYEYVSTVLESVSIHDGSQKQHNIYTRRDMETRGHITWAVSGWN
jgi:hypothetical protein